MTAAQERSSRYERCAYNHISLHGRRNDGSILHHIDRCLSSFQVFGGFYQSGFVPPAPIERYRKPAGSSGNIIVSKQFSVTGGYRFEGSTDLFKVSDREGQQEEFRFFVNVCPAKFENQRLTRGHHSVVPELPVNNKRSGQCAYSTKCYSNIPYQRPIAGPISIHAAPPCRVACRRFATGGGAPIMQGIPDSSKKNGGCT